MPQLIDLTRHLYGRLQIEPEALKLDATTFARYMDETIDELYRDLEKQRRALQNWAAGVYVETRSGVGDGH